jgi:hypothetical protein
MTTFVGYPSALPTNTRSGNFLFNGLSFNANYDITWSFEVSVGIDVAAEVGFTTFLCSQQNLIGGNVGVDLGYSGTGSQYADTNSYDVITPSLTSTVHAGIDGAVLGIGFDSTGLFALSCSVDDVLTRDGVALESINSLDSLIIRGGAPDYNLLSNDEFFNLDSSFNIFKDANTITQIRCRLGNVGRTLYIDYKPLGSLDYINLKTLAVSLSVADNKIYYVGLSYSSPVSSFSDTDTLTGGLVIKNFHVEGRYDDSPSYVIIGTDVITGGGSGSGGGGGVVTTTYNLLTEIQTLSTITPPTSGIQDVNLETNTENTDDSVIYIPV